MAVIGIDLGTSGCKAVVVGRDGTIHATATSSYPLSTPRPLWSEQDPADWWRGLVAAVREAVAAVPGEPIEAIGVAGQMHGAVLMDHQGTVLRPAILWNDGRCQAECELLHERVPRLVRETGNRALVGFTAPKLLWVQKHEPRIWKRVAAIALPKDWLRARLIGELVAEMSDASGMLLLDVAHRRWSQAMLAACRIDESHLGRLIEGSEVAGMLGTAVAAELGLPAGIPVVGGGGDQAAGAIGAGCIAPGATTIALGTSGVVFTTTRGYTPDKQGRLHSFCHALPGTWHQMGVMLSAAGSLQWFRDTCAPGVEFSALCAEAASAPIGAEGLTFLPYLTGERTPLFDPLARGGFIGLTRLHGRAHLARAVLEGICFGLDDSLRLIVEGGTAVREATVTGGGVRSAEWMQMLADITGVRVVLRTGADAGPALGAARLALIGGCGIAARTACASGPVEATYLSQAKARRMYQAPAERFRELYPRLRPHFHALA